MVKCKRQLSTWSSLVISQVPSLKLLRRSDLKTSSTFSGMLVVNVPTNMVPNLTNWPFSVPLIHLHFISVRTKVKSKSKNGWTNHPSPKLLISITSMWSPCLKKVTHHLCSSLTTLQLSTTRFSKRPPKLCKVKFYLSGLAIKQAFRKDLLNFHWSSQKCCPQLEFFTQAMT